MNDDSFELLNADGAKCKPCGGTGIIKVESGIMAEYGLSMTHKYNCSVCGGTGKNPDYDKRVLRDIRERYEVLCGRYLEMPLGQLHIDIGECLRLLDARSD